MARRWPKGAQAGGARTRPHLLDGPQRIVHAAAACSPRSSTRPHLKRSIAPSPAAASPSSLQFLPPRPRSRSPAMAAADPAAHATTSPPAAHGLPDEVITCLQNARFVRFAPCCPSRLTIGTAPPCNLFQQYSPHLADELHVPPLDTLLAASHDHHDNAPILSEDA